jgi:transcriptional regulator with XRE-family HTH domain
MSKEREISLGERVTELRTQRGLSQRELAAEVGRSESWVSQVERDVLRVERMPVLRALAGALGVSVRDLRPDAAGASPDEVRPTSDMDSLRMALTGHPAPDLLLVTRAPKPADIDALAQQVARAWELTHASAFGAVNGLLVQLLPDLERAWRQANEQQGPTLARLLSDAYQAAAWAFARLDEADAAWVAADRSITVAELGGDPLAALAGLFRMAHAFITLRRLDQAEYVAVSGITALAPQADKKAPKPEVLSLFGALHRGALPVRGTPPSAGRHPRPRWQADRSPRGDRTSPLDRRQTGRGPQRLRD